MVVVFCLRGAVFGAFFLSKEGNAVFGAASNFLGFASKISDCASKICCYYYYYYYYYYYHYHYNYYCYG